MLIRGGRKVRVREGDEPTEAGVGETMKMFRGSEDGKGQVPRNAGGLWKREKARKWILPSGFQKECYLADIFTFAQ